MAAAFSSYNQASFFFAKLNEFIHHWKSGRKASIKIECKEGIATHQMTCNLGYPDLPYVQDGAHRRRNKPRVKSEIRKARDNARAAAYQRARAPPPHLSPPSASSTARPDTSQAAPTIPPTTHRTVTSSAPSSPARSVSSLAVPPQVRSPPSASARQEDSPMETVWQPSELNDTRVAWQATVPLSPGPGILRAETEQPQDISSLPSPQLSSPRREPGRQEISETEIDTESVRGCSSECSSEDDSSLVLGLKILRTVQKCMKGRPHRCRDWRSCTEEEFQQLQEWWNLSVDQCPEEEELHPIYEMNELQGDHFSCSLLQLLRKIKEF